MADKSQKTEGNVPGPYYVDTECTACELCTDTAGDNFAMSDDGSSAYVKKQPENDEEKQNCESAKDDCPSDAIGNDG